MQKIVLVPQVKEYTLKSNKVKFTKVCHNESLTKYEDELLSRYVDSNIESNLFFKVDQTLGKEAYIINVLENEIYIYSSTSYGKHYAIITLTQLLKKVESL